uniref:Uncharacterized protein n=1 Tax=Phenylobacterium glaciei TaxID=2803784 RepID=A0A974S7K5_9CAUL|nr:hypothetical protein JKL49_19875 [Phenylobacterium glaciei]
MSQAAASVEISGEFRRPRNLAQEIKGSIHDDATASKLGFRGGTVAGRSIWTSSSRRCWSSTAPTGSGAGPCPDLQARHRRQRGGAGVRPSR